MPDSPTGGQHPTGEASLRAQLDPFLVPRFGGPTTFARLPRIDEVEQCGIAIVGIPYDQGVTYRPGARFGPQAIRLGSKLLRHYNPQLDVAPFALVQVADAGDMTCNPFNVATAIQDIEMGARDLGGRCGAVVALGGDHSVALPLLRAASDRFGKLAVLHFDSHLDTLDSAYGCAYTHGTPFRRASEEDLLADEACIHVGIHGPLFGREDLEDDARLGFQVVSTTRIDEVGIEAVSSQIRSRVADRAVYVSVDIDVLDPAYAPGTGTPEPGGLTTRELLRMLRLLAGIRIVGADLVEVAPAYDHAETTALAASHVVYELTSLIAQRLAEDAGGRAAAQAG